MEGWGLGKRLMLGGLIICIVMCIVVVKFNRFVEEFGRKIGKINEKGG